MLIPRKSCILTAAVVAISCSGCLQSGIDENARTVQQQQAQIAQLQKQVESLQAQQYNPANAAPPPGTGCDKDVMAAATKRGGEKFAVSDFSRALGYYMDSLTACPGNPRAEVNVGRTFEAMHDRASAMEHYARAAGSADASDRDAEEEARAALARLRSSK